MPGSVLVLGVFLRLVKNAKRRCRNLGKIKKRQQGSKIMKNRFRIHAKALENYLGAPLVAFGRASWWRNLKT